MGGVGGRTGRQLSDPLRSPLGPGERGFNQSRGWDSPARLAFLSTVVFIIFHSQTVLEAGCQGN